MGEYNMSLKDDTTACVECKSSDNWTWSGTFCRIRTRIHTSSNQNQNQKTTKNQTKTKSCRMSRFVMNFFNWTGPARKQPWLIQTMVWNISVLYTCTGVVPGRWGTGHASIVPYQTFQTLDGHLTVGCGSNSHFRQLSSFIIQCMD